MNQDRMIELDPALRLVVAFAIIVIGSGLIIPSYIMEMKKSRIKNRGFTSRTR